MAGCVERDKKSLANDEVGTYIGAGYRFGFIGDPAKEGGAVDFGRVSGGAKAQFVSADELQWVGPGFQAARCVAHDDGFASVGRDESFGGDGVGVEG